jgi:ubiquinone/menaquinone biosynthesis C-methylase UbiE
MNANSPEAQALFDYYESDCPLSVLAEQRGGAGTQQLDVARYREVVRAAGGPVLELCGGSGRVAIPLARDGFAVTAVDVSREMLDRFRAYLRKEDGGVAGRVTLVEQDVSRLDLPDKEFRVVICAVSGLLLLVEQEAQLAMLRAAAAHLVPGGTLALDVANPLSMRLAGDEVPRLLQQRTNVQTGNAYTMFLMADPMDTAQRQRLHGWYDEVLPDGIVKRRPFAHTWRAIFPGELALMLAATGFALESIDGGYRREPFTRQSPYMFVRAKKLPAAT